MKTFFIAIIAATLATFAMAEPQPQPAPAIALIAGQPPPQAMGLAVREPAIIAKAHKAISVAVREQVMDEHGHRVYRSLNRGPQVKRRCGSGCSCGASCSCAGCVKHLQRDVVFPKRIPVSNAEPAAVE